MSYLQLTSVALSCEWNKEGVAFNRKQGERAVVRLGGGGGGSRVQELHNFSSSDVLRRQLGVGALWSLCL